MGTNGFREDELVTRKMKINGVWETRVFPIVGGRLRIVHESHDNLSIRTEVVKLEPDFVVIRASAQTTKGKFNGTGTASTQRDARLADSLVELAETRAIARALRFGGIGVEYTGAEEVSHVVAAESEKEQTTGKEVKSVFPEENQGNKPAAKSGGNGNGRSSQAQCRALYALTKKARYGENEIARMLRPMDAPTFEDLSREDASRLISYLQTEIAH